MNDWVRRQAKRNWKSLKRKRKNKKLEWIIDLNLEKM